MKHFKRFLFSAVVTAICIAAGAFLTKSNFFDPTVYLLLMLCLDLIILYSWAWVLGALLRLGLRWSSRRFARTPRQEAAPQEESTEKEPAAV